MGFIAAIDPRRLAAPPETRIDRKVVAEYVRWRKKWGEVMSLGADLALLRAALKLICPNIDWSWLLTIIRRLDAAASREVKKYHLVTSERLYLLGIELMDRAVAEADAAQRINNAHAFHIATVW